MGIGAMAGDESGHPCGEGQCSFRQPSGRAAFDAGRSEGGCWGVLSGSQLKDRNALLVIIYVIGGDRY